MLQLVEKLFTTNYKQLFQQYLLLKNRSVTE